MAPPTSPPRAACTCPSGYDATTSECTQINECMGGTHNCFDVSGCTDIAGSFSCACPPGYSGDGVSCSDVDECALGRAGAHECDAARACSGKADECSATSDANKAAMAEYKPTESYTTKPSNLDFDALPDAPEEWTGPFNGKKLRGLANGGKLGVGKFFSFEEAEKAAVELGEECSGITYEAKFAKYSLRKKFEWCGDGVEGEDCSWVRGEIEVSKPKATKPKATKPKAEKK